MIARPINVLELRSVRGTGGGPEKTILLGTERAARERFRVTVCYLRDARDSVFGIGRLAARLPIEYVEIVERHSFDWRIWPQLKALIKRISADIVHAHDYKTNALTWALAQQHPTIIPLSTVHGWTGHTMRERYVYYPADKRLLSRFPQLIAVSSEIRSELVHHGASPARVAVVLNGIDPQKFRRDPEQAGSARAQYGFSERDTVIGAVGRLEPQKRFDLLLRAFASVRADRTDLRLVIAGDGSLRATLAALAQQLGIATSCLFVGHTDEVVHLHHAFDLFVQSSDYEGTPNAVLEAMALQTPVVATAAGGTAEILRDSVEGIIVPTGDLGALVRAIRLVLDDPNATVLRVQAARRRVERELSFEVRTRRLEAIYQSLVAARDARASATAHA